MKKMTFSEIKKTWLNFFINKKHHLENSVSLIPDSSDESLLWVNAGIVPLKKYFDGSQKVSFPKIVNIQKCLRTSDIEKVGKSMFHHTFFEMLGNFSIGDYFKKEAIDFAYELLMSDKFFGLPQEKLYITYFDKDLETYHLWLDKGISSDHLIPFKNNFWEIGEGPCGPCTEIFFDRGNKYNSKGIELIIEDISNNRFVEIWNIVFSQYNSESGKNRENYSELPSKNIDTGAGLERLACVLQETETNFETDLFWPIIEKISFLSKKKYSEKKEFFKIIADHIKTLVFGLGDGVIFSNIGRGYILKKILRRAFFQGQKLNLTAPFLFQLVSVVIDLMEEFYPYLRNKQTIIENMIKKEEDKFLFHLEKSAKLFQKLVSDKFLSGENFFKLYDTYGLPKEMILEYAQMNNLQVDEKEFEIYLTKQKELSRENSNIKNNMNIQKELFMNFKDKSDFIGYNIFETKTKILKLFDEGIVLSRTPFFPIMGGQKSDSGQINGLQVTKVIKLPNNQFLHQFNESFQNLLSEGQEVLASIDLPKRKKTSLNHTATHLLQDVLRYSLDENILFKGSSLDDQFLRIDFSYYRNLSQEELFQIENKVNEFIEKKEPVIIREMPFAEAIKQKAQFIENKTYPEIVRVVRIGDFSIQLCGGTHASNTEELKRFVILDYKLIGSGIYRVEATSGHNVSFFLKEKLSSLFLEEKQILQKIEKIKNDNSTLDQSFFQIDQNLISNIKYNSYKDIQNYKSHLDSLRKQFGKMKKYISQKQNEKILKEIDNFIPRQIEKQIMIIIDDDQDISGDILKVLLDKLFQKINNDFLCLCHKKTDQFIFLCKSKTINANGFIQKINLTINGRGGGNNHFGQSFSRDINKFDQFKNNWKKFL
ncbi:alanine--tRNA ligase ['Camptotheca acuminata' phytoplasma]|uniref:alanine--tRNA ligase n=1 Tax='Camptotheca acuminata' phytoplasma TaxID=3239192 RepID=UPI00351A6EBF